MEILTQTHIRKILCYNPFTGNFMWRIPNSNRVYVGMRAGSIQYIGINKQPYRFIGVSGKKYPAHRLAFLYMIGHFPFGEVDHRDGDGLNNRWLNLRDATHSQNLANCGPSKNSKLGVKGVYLTKSGRYYKVKIMVRGKRIYLGRYKTLDEAVIVHKRAATKYFGEFAKVT